jgi:hypothetical protein
MQLLLVMGILSYLLDLRFSDCTDSRRSSWPGSDRPTMRKLKRHAHGYVDGRAGARRAVVDRVEKFHSNRPTPRSKIGESVPNNRDRRGPLEVRVLTS